MTHTHSGCLRRYVAICQRTWQAPDLDLRSKYSPLPKHSPLEHLAADRGHDAILIGGTTPQELLSVTVYQSWEAGLLPQRNKIDPARLAHCGNAWYHYAVMLFWSRKLPCGCNPAIPACVFRGKLSHYTEDLAALTGYGNARYHNAMILFWSLKLPHSNCLVPMCSVHEKPGYYLQAIK